MPPDPVLGLLAFLGLMIYTLIGAILASVALRFLSPDNYYPFLAGKKDYNWPGEVWASLAVLTALWLPILAIGIPLAVVVGAVVAAVAGPAFLALKVAKYSSKTQMEMKEAA